MRDHVAAQTQTFRIEPSPSGEPVTVTVPRQSIASAPPKKGRRKKSSFDRCLVIGFDTEYQAHDGLTKKQAVEQQARNQVLSYQYSISLISKDQPDHTISTEGIVVPNDNERLSLADFLAIAIGDLCGKFPSTQIPTDIYLVSHFTKADMPAFTGFSTNAKRFLSNIRNTFVSMANSIPLLIDHGSDEKSEFHVRLRDTILLAPQGCKKLADIADMLGMQKIVIHKDPQQEKLLKANMLGFSDKQLGSISTIRNPRCRDLSEVCRARDLAECRPFRRIPTPADLDRIRDKARQK